MDLSTVIQQCSALSAFDIPFDASGKLLEGDREKFGYDLFWRPDATDQERERALIALWFNGTDFDSISLAWWASKKEQSLLRILAMAVYNLRWEPTSVMLPYGVWADRFEKSERDLRHQECLFLETHSAKIASDLLKILDRELKTNPNDNMKLLHGSLKSIFINRGMPKL